MTTAATRVPESGNAPPPAAARPTVPRRAAVALGIGLGSAVLCYLFLHRAGFYPDFIYPWTAARVLRAGLDPYRLLPGGLPEPYRSPLFYPLPAALIALPVAPLPLAPAGALFFGASSTLLAFAVTRDGWERLPLFVSGPFIVAASLGQWAPLVMGAALVPGLEWLGVAKPNLGFALWLRRPGWRAALGGTTALAASCVLLPAWPVEWLHSLAFDQAHAMHAAPLLAVAGPLLLLAALRWRTPEGRLLLGMALVPQKLFFYDQLPLALVARTFRESLALAAVSAGAAIVWVATTTEATRERLAVPYVMLAVYLPALIVVLRHASRARVAGSRRGG